MKIEVNVQAPELVEAVNNLAAAMGTAPAVETPVKKKEEASVKKEAPAKQEDSKEDEPKKFSRASYYYHEESDSYLAFKKGDEVPTEPGFTDAKAISKKDYDKGIAEQKKAEEEPEEKEEFPTVEEVREKTAEASKAGKREEIKDLLAEFGVTAVSKIPEDQRADYLEKLEDL